MVNKPLVSIVTPSYNQAEYLEMTINSVLNQDYPRIEYLVVDGGSSDGSLDIIRRYQDSISWWVSEEDQGQTDAINKGFGKASGDLYSWINSDDILHPSAVSEAVKFMEDNPHIGLVYGDLNFIDQNGTIIGKFNAKQTDYRKLRRGSVYIPQPAAFWRADLWNKVGPLDPSLYFAMDYDLWTKIAFLAPIHYHEGYIWADFRVHDASKTIIADQQCWEEMLKIHRRDGGGWFSFLVTKYWIRKIIGPLWRWNKQRKYGI